MSPRLFVNAARIHYGLGCLAALGPEAASMGRKAFVVTGRSSSKNNGSLDRVCAILAQAGVASVVFAEVESDPSVETVERGAALALAAGADVVVALGGGSPLDAAKGVSCLMANPGPIQNYETAPPPKAGPCVIAIPTTAGTGSEVTRVAVLTDTALKRKLVIAGQTLVPAVAILDPELTASMPPHVAAATGMDALTHAVEAYVSKVSNPLSDTLALSAIRLVAANLAKAVLAPDNVEARSNMLLAQLQAGQAFTNASVGLVHAMSRPLGAWFGVPHGVANAMLLPAVAAYNRPACPERMADVARALMRTVDGLSLRLASEQAAPALAELQAELPLPVRLSDVGVQESALAQLAQDACENASSRVNPRTPTLADVEGLYRKLL